MKQTSKTKQSKQRVSDAINTNDIKKWNIGDIITITAGTGAGKSYFIKDALYKFAKENNKKILMLIHRTNCVSQFTKEITANNKTDTIEIMTYQALESLKINGKKEFDFSKYQYIVCDEFHYFMGDAPFNISTDISLDIILKQSNVIKIFMSATGQHMARFINGVKKTKTINYEIPIKYNFIKDLYFYNNDDTLFTFIENAIKENHKCIFFIQSAKKAYNLYKKYKQHALFNCSKDNKTHYQYVDQDKIDNMLINEKFEELILITTTCLDAGVNIIDDAVKHIVVDVEDIGSLIQCIGRKRITNKNDKIILYIKTINNKQLGGKETQLNKKLEMAEYFKSHTVKEYIEKYYKQYDKSSMVYDDTTEDENRGIKRLNELMYYKCKLDIHEINMMKKLGNFGYCKYLARKFNFYNEATDYYEYKVVEEQKHEETLNDYLDSIVGKKLYKDDQNELINKIDLRVNRRQQRSYSKLNDGLKMIDLPYIIIPKRNNSDRYWVVEKIG